MRIGGIQKTSLIDYPDHICAILFTIGCNFRCPYCHNPELVDESATPTEFEDALSIIKPRINVLDAVTITGGEPTIHEDLPACIRSIRGLGLKVKLDTNGTNPEMLEALLAEGLLDYVAMDIKAPLHLYSKTVAHPVNTSAIEKSITMLIAGSTPYEFRTTVVKTLLPREAFKDIGEMIKGANIYRLQKFIPSKLLNPGFLRKVTYSDTEFKEIQKEMLNYVSTCTIR